MKAVHWRLLLAGGFALSIGLPLLACSGTTLPTTPTDAVTDAPAPEPEKADPAKKIIGTWRMVPDEKTLRELKVIDAALSGKPQKKEKLGDLTADEQKLFNEWDGKKGDEAKSMKSDIKFAKNCLFEFTDKQVTVRFGEDEVLGPVDYTMVSATDTNTTVKFDPQLGNGVETHSFDWENETKGVDKITAENGREFFPLNVSKR
ncbi:MAG: hypothetical protein ABMB14_12015 [Myxococcota bacterium]